MLSFQNLSIRNKLLLLTSSSVLVAATLICAAVVYNDAKLLSQAKRREVITLVEVLGRTVTSAIEFNDTKTAVELLQSLSNQPTLTAAAIYDNEDRLFAKYTHDTVADTLIPETAPHSGDAFTKQDRLEVARKILHDEHGEKIGTVWIQASLDEVHAQRAKQLTSTVSLVAVALLIAMLTAIPFQRAITQPIHEVVNAARLIASENTTTHRVPKHGKDEMGTLCDAFNHMLDRLAASHGELQAAHDALELRVTERTLELRSALEEAQAANMAKSNFLANMSHEIRTPMTAVLGYAELLEEEQISPAGHERIEIILRNGRHLLSLINDILDVSKVEAGKLIVERIDYSICELLADATSLLRPQAAAKGLSLEVRYDGDIPARIKTDPTRLRQVLVNLIGNAIKFTSHGSVELVVSLKQPVHLRPSPDDEMLLQFDVIDTGMGLTEAQIANIFRPFTQADETMTRRFGGTGLGLTISRALARALGGDITVVSQPNVGSRFTLTVGTGPLAGVAMLTECHEVIQPQRETRQEVVAKLPTLSGKILLVEDGLDNQRLVSVLLKKAGAEVTVAENGLLGRNEALEAWRSGAPFAVILMDMQMPVMDGYEATRDLRSENYQFPIIALTAHAMSHDRERCLNAGCDDFLNKPIDRTVLIRTIDKWMQFRPVSITPNEIAVRG